MIRCVSFSEVNPEVRAEEGLEEPPRLPDMSSLLPMLSEEGLEIKLRELDLRVHGVLPTSRVEDGGAAEELPYAHESDTPSLLVVLEVDGGVIRDVGEQHGLVDAKPWAFVLNYDVDGVDDRRPELGELEAARDELGIDVLLVACLKLDGVLQSADVWRSELRR